jgi:hypothetical protein
MLQSLFKLEGDAIVMKPFFDAVAVFRRVAHEIHFNKEIDPHEAYEEELKERARDAGYLDS